MSKLDIIRAWKDEDYLDNLSESDRSLLPQNPAGVIELTDRELLQAEGGTTHSITLGCNSLAMCLPTLGCPPSFTLEDQISPEG